MQKTEPSPRIPTITGVICLLFGLMTEGLFGSFFLLSGNPLCLLLHIPSALLWSVGVNMLYLKSTASNDCLYLARMPINKWGATAALLSLCTYPGLAALAGSIALLVIRSQATVVKTTVAETDAIRTIVPVPEMDARPLIELLQDADLETRRRAVAALSRQGTANAILQLRQLLSDPQFEIRSDASIALTRLEEEYARVLNQALEQWNEYPDRQEHTIELARQYYCYASSNVLDVSSQHVYYSKAYALLQPLMGKQITEYQIWMLSARICQSLHKNTEALEAVQVALQLCPTSIDIHALALEMAFNAQEWQDFLSLLRQSSTTLPATADLQQMAHWWLSPSTEKQKESIYG